MLNRKSWFIVILGLISTVAIDAIDSSVFDPGFSIEESILVPEIKPPTLPEIETKEEDNIFDVESAISSYLEDCYHTVTVTATETTPTQSVEKKSNLPVSSRVSNSEERFGERTERTNYLTGTDYPKENISVAVGKASAFSRPIIIIISVSFASALLFGIFLFYRMFSS
ncbi:unnamed protein product [Trichobilharzia szidati]|nr:unnamed protein product [Trichobilharzia szidati]